MAWYEDLAECDYFGLENAQILRAVGWLEKGKNFPLGTIDKSVYEKLCQFRQTAWMPIRFRGIHKCDLCQFNGEVGSKCIFIPNQENIFVCPELIIHYINSHSYDPPQEFCEKVLACPPMGSIEYLKQILDNGGRCLIKNLK